MAHGRQALAVACEEQDEGTRMLSEGRLHTSHSRSCCQPLGVGAADAVRLRDSVERAVPVRMCDCDSLAELLCGALVPACVATQYTKVDTCGGRGACATSEDGLHAVLKAA